MITAARAVDVGTFVMARVGESGHCAGHFTAVEERLPGTSLLDVLTSRGAARSVEEEVGEAHRTTGHWVAADDNRLMCWLLGPAVNVAHVLRRWGRSDLDEALTRWAHQTAGVLRGQRCRVATSGRATCWCNAVGSPGSCDWGQAGFHAAGRMSPEPRRANNPRWVARDLVAVASVLKNGNRK